MKPSSNAADMTTGSPVRLILTFSIPLVIGNIFQQFYNMVDSIVVGNFVGSDALGAVGACGSLNWLFFSLSSGLGIGIGVIVSQFYGARQYDKVRATIANSFYVLISAALVVSLLCFLIAPSILRLLGTPDDIIGDSIIYMRTTCLGIIAISLYNGVSSILRALGDSKTPLYFLILSSICNVLLDLLFVIAFGWGVFGVALATIFSQALSAIVSLIYSFRKISYFHLTKELMKPDAAIIKNSYRLGVPVALQSSMVAVSCVALQAVVNSFGSTVVSAFTITNRIEQLIQQPYNSLGTALTTYAGQNIGAGNTDRVKLGFRKSIGIVAVFSAIMIPVMFFFGKNIAGLFVKEADVIELGASALRITSVFYFFLGLIYIPRGILNGCGDAAFSMINGIAEVVCRLLYSSILTRIPAIGHWGIWITTGLTWLSVCIVCLLRYASGKWKHKAMKLKTDRF